MMRSTSIRALQLSVRRRKEALVAANFRIGSSYNATRNKSCIITGGMQLNGKNSGNTHTSLHRPLSRDKNTTTNGSEGVPLVTKEILQAFKEMQTNMERREKEMQAERKEMQAERKEMQAEMESREKEMQAERKEMQAERKEMQTNMERREKEMQAERKEMQMERKEMQTEMESREKEMQAERKEMQTERKENKTEMEKMRRGMEKLSEQVQSRATPSTSPAIKGKASLLSLEKLRSFVLFQVTDKNADSVLTESEQRRLSECETEHQVVAYITQHLERVFADMDLFLVNSEKYSWLKTSNDPDPKYNQMPDLFLGHRAIVETKEPFKSNDVELTTKLRQDSNVFGKLQDWKLRDCIPTIFEGKKKISKNQAFGEMINYGSHICYEDGPIDTRMVLFDVSEFWLIECTKGIATRVTTCGWTMAGSTKLLRNFIVQKPWIDLLERACSDFGVDVGTNAFLGSGRYGRVFRVQRKSDGAQLALKLVLDGNDGKPRYDGHDVPSLKREYEITESVKNICPEFVLGVEENGFRSLSNGGGLLLSGVGGPVPEEQYGNLIASLGSLHEKDIIHGDARLYNAVVLNGTVKWMDFRPTYLVYTKKDDMKSLLATIGVAKDKADEVVDSYKGTREDAERIAKLVC